MEASFNCELTLSANSEPTSFEEVASHDEWKEATSHDEWKEAM